MRWVVAYVKVAAWGDFGLVKYFPHAAIVAASFVSSSDIASDGRPAGG